MVPAKLTKATGATREIPEISQYYARSDLATGIATDDAAGFYLSSHRTSATRFDCACFRQPLSTIFGVPEMLQASMETNIQSSIQAMGQQLELYQAAGCEVLKKTGCGEMRRQLGQTYGVMLDAMDNALPDMESAINRSRSSLEETLGRQLGRSMSPTAIQDMMLDDGSRVDSRSNRRTNAGRLSQRFEQYHRLVAALRQA